MPEARERMSAERLEELCGLGNVGVWVELTAELCRERGRYDRLKAESDGDMARLDEAHRRLAEEKARAEQAEAEAMQVAKDHTAVVEQLIEAESRAERLEEEVRLGRKLAEVLELTKPCGENESEMVVWIDYNDWFCIGEARTALRQHREQGEEK